MKQNTEVFKDRMIDLLEELADRSYQIRSWVKGKVVNGDRSISYTEAVIELFDDALVIDALNNNATLYDRNVTQALRELSKLTNLLDENNRPALEIINDPLMQQVREKAAEILALIKASDKSENTVTFIEEGTLKVLEP